MTARSTALALATSLALVASACSQMREGTTVFSIQNDTSVDLELIWFDEAFWPEVISQDGEHFQVSGGSCSKSCDDLSAEMIVCDAMAPSLPIPAGQRFGLVWSQQRQVPDTNLFGQACIRHEDLPEETYTVRICLREVTDMEDTTFVCKTKEFEVSYDIATGPDRGAHFVFGEEDLP